MDEGTMHPPEYARDQSDEDLDAKLAAAEDRLLTAIQARIDLDAGLAEIIGASAQPGTIGGDELAASCPGERRSSPAGPSAEESYIAGAGQPLYLQVVALQAQEADAAAGVQAAMHAMEHAERIAGERKRRHGDDISSGLIWPVIGILLSLLRVFRARRRYSAALAHQAKAREKRKIAAARLQQDFLAFLLETEDPPFDQARRRADEILYTAAASGIIPPLDRRSSADPRRLRRAAVVLAAVAVVAAVVAAAVTVPFPDPRVGSGAGPVQYQRPSMSAQFLAFTPGQASLSEATKTLLRTLASLVPRTGPGQIVIEGYADPGVSYATDFSLSYARARAVATFLEKQGVPASMIRVAPVVHSAIAPQGATTSGVAIIMFT
jgi:flagellar motor protein MotB